MVLSMGKWWAALAAGMMLAAAGTGTAQAAGTPLGTGDTPRVIASPDGTLHAAWVEQDGSGHHLLHYCRIPASATACETPKTWDFGTSGSLTAEIVREPASGTIDVIGLAYATSGGIGDGEWLFRSTNPEAAGSTFAPQKKIANVDLPFYPGNSGGGGAVFGPNAFQVGVLSDTNGVDLQIATTNAPGTDYQLVDNIVPAGDFQAVGLVNSTTVMVVGRKLDVDGGQFSWRQSNGSDAARNLATWKPMGQTTGIGSPWSFAANGIGAPVLTSVDKVEGNDTRIALRHFAPGGAGEAGAFGPPVTVSDLDSTLSPETYLDGSSNVHVVFTRNVAGDQEIDYLASPTGDTWPAKPLVVAPVGENPVPASLRVAASPDGNGAVFWRKPAGTGSSEDDTIYISRVQGPGSAFPPPDAPPAGGGTTPPPVDPSCVKTPSLGIAKFLATACFTRSGKTLTTTSVFRLNGLQFDPKGKTVKLDETTRTMTAPAGVALSLGPISFGSSARTWKFPASGSFDPGVIDFDKGGLGGALLKLELAGDATLKLTDAKTELATHMQLPAPFDTVNGDVKLKADNFSGLQLDGLHIRAEELPYGFHDIDLEYVSDPPTWKGTLFWRSAAAGGDDFGATIRIVDGALEFVKVDGKFGAPGKEIYPPFLFMRYLGLSLQTKPKLVLEGSTILSAGPSAGDTSIVGIGHPFDTFGKLTLTLAAPFKLDAYAPVYVLGFRLGQGELHYTFPGDVSFAAHAEIGDCSEAGASMDVSGLVKASSPPAFNAYGKAKACLLGASVSVDGVLSSKGIAACGHFGLSDTFSVDAGAGHLWDSDSVDIKLEGCSTEPYSVSSTRQAGGARTFPVKAGLKQLNITVRGDTAPPAVVVTAPDGTTFTSSATAGVKGTRHVAVPNQGGRTQQLLVAKPPAGTWTVTPVAGSAAITGLSLATSAPTPSVKGRVRKVGSRRELRWTAADRDGKTLELFEEGDGVLRRLAAPTGTSGTVRWVPKGLRGGKRRVTAIVSQDGLPLRKVTLASYVLPRPPKPGRARGLSASHKGTKLVLRWRPGARAARQEVHVALGDGTKKLFRLSGRARTLTLPAIATRTTGRFTVTGLRADGVRGPVARGTVKAAAKKKKKRRG